MDPLETQIMDFPKEIMDFPKEEIMDPGVPETKFGDSICVNVLRRSLEFGKYCKLMTSCCGIRVVCFQKHGSVTLNNQGPLRHPYTLNQKY